MSLREILFAFVLLIAAAFVVAGVAQASRPAAFVVAGVAFAVWGWLILAGPDEKPKPTKRVDDLLGTPIEVSDEDSS